MPSAADILRKTKGSNDPTRAQALRDVDLGLSNIILDGKAADARITGAILDGEIERTIEGASTVTLNVLDPKRELLNSKIVKEAVRVEIDDYAFRLAKVTKTGDIMQLVFEDEAVYWMRRYKKPKKAYRDKVTRALFARSLVKEVKQVKIGFWSPELRKKQRIGRSSEPRSAREERTSSGDGGFSTTNFTIKGRKANRSQVRILEIAMRSADEERASDKATGALIVALIQEATVSNPTGGDGDSAGALQLRAFHGPMSRRRNVEYVCRTFLRQGYWGKGGAIELAKKHPGWSAGKIAQQCQGSAYPNAYDQWRSEATRIRRAWRGGAGGGGGGGGSVSVRTRRYAFSRGQGRKREDTWTCLGRLAEEVGWSRFMVGKEVWFAAQADLIKMAPAARFKETSQGIVNIDFDFDVGKPSAEATITARADRWASSPGAVVVLDDLGPNDGPWLVSTIRRPIFSADVTITLKQPIRELPEPAPETREVRTASSASSSGRGSARAGKIGVSRGARGIVNDAFHHCAEQYGTFVVSGYRPGDPKDHGGNGDYKAARDIAVRGIDAIGGPPSPRLDKAVVAIGKAFGRNYGNGRRTIIDTFQWKGYRVQILWRTPLYGGHMGHIHIGARKN